MIDQLRSFIQQSSLRCSFQSMTLNSADKDFLQLLSTRPAIEKKKHSNIQKSNEKKRDDFHRRVVLFSASEIPLTDTFLNMAFTCLHSRDAFITNESIYRIFRTIFGHFVEKFVVRIETKRKKKTTFLFRFVKNEIDEILSREQILVYLSDIRTKVLWPDEDKPFVPIKNVKRRAFYACINKIPCKISSNDVFVFFSQLFVRLDWFRTLIGHENVNRIIGNAIQCLSYSELNQFVEFVDRISSFLFSCFRHFLCKFFELIVDQLIPNVAKGDFIRKYVHMHAGMR